MPNVKLHVDHALLAKAGDRIDAVLRPLRDLLCDRFDVPVPACQLAVIAVRGLADQPQVNVELQVLPRPDRTRERVSAICAEIQALVAGAAGSHTAVRLSFLDGETYLALK